MKSNNKTDNLQTENRESEQSPVKPWKGYYSLTKFGLGGLLEYQMDAEINTV